MSLLIGWVGAFFPSRFVEDSDVAEAVRLMRVATQNAATDPRTGTIDMDMIATGQGASDRWMQFSLTAALLGLSIVRPRSLVVCSLASRYTQR